MSWIQLNIRSAEIDAHAIEFALESAGALAVSMVDAADQPLFEPGPGETPLWADIVITGLFSQEADPLQVIACIKDCLTPAQLAGLEVTSLADRNWVRAWMDEFKPMRFGERLWICPSWTVPPDPDAVNLLLDPGLAFGTGTHPTTALCLSWLDSKQPTDMVIIDYGCGSGILGLAALKLGARIVHGVDNDPQALVATRDNSEKNAIDPACFPVWLPDEFYAAVNAGQIARVDGIAANILAQPLIELASTLANLIKPGGWILLSGILEDQAQNVMTAYSPWFRIDSIDSMHGWVRLTATLTVPPT
jgi:ribosomal protein L11 methyltransferase